MVSDSLAIWVCILRLAYGSDKDVDSEASVALTFLCRSKLEEFGIIIWLYWLSLSIFSPSWLFLYFYLLHLYCICIFGFAQIKGLNVLEIKIGCLFTNQKYHMVQHNVIWAHYIFQRRCSACPQDLLPAHILYISVKSLIGWDWENWAVDPYVTEMFWIS